LVTISEAETLYSGYGDDQCTTIGVMAVTGGEGPYTYEWSTGETTETISVCPESTQTYSVIITDVNGCEATAETTVEVIDVSCGNNSRFPRVQVCYRGRSLCVPEIAASRLLDRGATLGSCEASTPEDLDITVYPNPFKNRTSINFSEPTAKSYRAYLYNRNGRLVYLTRIPRNPTEKRINVPYLKKGIYFLNIYDRGTKIKSIKVIKN